MSKKLYKIFLSHSLQETLIYRSTSIFIVIFGFMFFVIELISGMIYFEYTDSVLGWTKNDYYMLICTSNMIQCGYQMLFSSAHESLSEKIIEGDLDYIFIRPVNSFLYYVLYRVDIPSIINFVVATVMQVVIMQKNNYSLGQVICFAVFIILGIWFLFLINQIMVMASFWKEKSNKLMGVPEYLVDAATRPKDMYPNVIKYIFIWMIPVFTTINGPIDILKNQYNVVSFIWYFLYLILFSFITYWLWLKGLEKYKSAN